MHAAMGAEHYGKPRQRDAWRRIRHSPGQSMTGAFFGLGTRIRASSLAINRRATIAAARLRPPYLALPCVKMPHLTQALCYCSSSAQSQRLRREADTRNVRPREGLLLASVPGPGHPAGAFCFSEGETLPLGSRDEDGWDHFTSAERGRRPSVRFGDVASHRLNGDIGRLPVTGIPLSTIRLSLRVGHRLARVAIVK